ncbi:MAG: MmgE/PrpD family protein, partial [Rhizobiales bacterium]|nr:MmgE/PrpD family protein [Hyphomicrobiales bacterium]
MAQSLTEKLIELCTRPVPQGVRERAARHLLDWLGCALVGSTSAQGAAFARYAPNRQAGGHNCFAINSQPCSPTQAAFLNGGLGNIFEMDDVHRASILHAGDVVIPAALAASQAKNASAANLLEAIVRGYEVALRIGITASQGGYSAWYNSGTCGVFGAAAAAGLATELSTDELADALGQAGMMASGIWQCRLEPTFSKQLATAHAAQSGVIAAQLAGAGFPGAKHILEGELGFFKTYYPKADPALTIHPAVSQWKIEEVSFKPWSACRHTHPVIEAALALRNRCPATDIAKITISTYQAAIDFCDNPAAQSDHEARFSLQHCVAVSLLRNEPQISDFDACSRADPSVKSLIERMSIEVDSALSDQFPSMMGS